MRLGEACTSLCLSVCKGAVCQQLDTPGISFCSWLPKVTFFNFPGSRVFINEIRIAVLNPGPSLQFSSVNQSCLTLRPHGLQYARPPCPSPTPRVYPDSSLSSESIQTHVHCVGDAIQTSHPLLSPSLPAFNPSQHLGIFK